MLLNKEKILSNTNYYHLKKFKGSIGGKLVEGVIYIEDGCIYFFQNKANGRWPEGSQPHQYGYDYSWIWDFNVEGIELIEDDGWKEVTGSIADVALAGFNPTISTSFDSDLKFNIAKKKVKKGKGTTPFKLKLF